MSEERNAVDTTSAPVDRDAAMESGRMLFGMISEGYDGEQIAARCGIELDRAEVLIAAYVRRVLYGTAPAAPTAECLVNGYDGWCMKHGCYHPGHG